MGCGAKLHVHSGFNPIWQRVEAMGYQAISKFRNLYSVPSMYVGTNILIPHSRIFRFHSNFVCILSIHSKILVIKCVGRLWFCLSVGVGWDGMGWDGFQALSSAASKWDKVKAEQLQRARKTLGISQDVAIEMHKEVYRFGCMEAGGKGGGCRWVVSWEEEYITPGDGNFASPPIFFLLLLP